MRPPSEDVSQPFVVTPFFSVLFSVPLCLVVIIDFLRKCPDPPDAFPENLWGKFHKLHIACCSTAALWAQ
jgi:hypothetical protein